MQDNYPKAYKEVIEILNHVPPESVNKIPQTLINTFKTKMDINYNFKINLNKDFKEQDLLIETKAILANIFRDYWATPHQKKLIIAKEQYDLQKIEKEKENKYNTNIFDRKNINKLNNNINNLPVKIKKENFYHKIINFLKKIFHIEGE